MDIYQLIKQDHDEVKSLFERIRSRSGERSRNELFNTLSEELSIHMKLEEKLFYPQIENEKDIRASVLEAYEEHSIAKKLLKEFGGVADEDRWMAKLGVMEELIRDHIREEEGEIFRKSRSVIDKNAARDLGGRFEKEKERMMAGAR